MPLPVLLALVIGGIGGIALLLHLLGYTTRLDLRDEEAAMRCWEREFPETPALSAHPDDTGKAALIETPRGPGLVWAMGADSCARLMTEGGHYHFDGDQLTLTFDDPGMGHLHLALAPGTRADWAPLLESLT